MELNLRWLTFQHVRRVFGETFIKTRRTIVEFEILLYAERTVVMSSCLVRIVSAMRLWMLQQGRARSFMIRNEGISKLIQLPLAA